MVNYINTGEILIKIPIYLSNKNECMTYCNELPFGILCYSSYIDLEKMKVVFFSCRKN